jgi:carbamoylphosphate synthase small subunit
MAGNYRIARSELESDAVRARGQIVSRMIEPPPGPGLSLGELLAEGGVPAISGIDTRAHTLELRHGAARRAVIVPAEVAEADALAAARGSVAWGSASGSGCRRARSRFTSRASFRQIWSRRAAPVGRSSMPHATSG